jgi:diguanylate cyclase (GGDEF)-like protein/PAS domain S-box-containing protein
MSDITTSMPPAFETTPLASALLTLLQSSGALVAVKDMATARYIHANTAFARLTGRTPAEVVGRGDIELFPLADAAAIRAADQRALAVDAPSEDEHRFERDDGKHEFRATRMVIGSDVAPQIVHLWWDETAARHAHSQTTTQLQQALKQIERQQGAIDTMARVAPVPTQAATELFGSDHFDEHARRELALSTREHREFAVALLTLDRAGALEQRYGAGAVKRVMDAVGQILRTNTRAMDVISRVGNDRYAILLSGVGLATAYTRMEQMRRQCATHIVVHDGHPLGFEVSVGIASFPHTADHLEALSSAADFALRESVRRGGNRVALAPVPLGERVELAAAA